MRKRMKCIFPFVNVPDLTPAVELLRGQGTVVYTDFDCQGIKK